MRMCVRPPWQMIRPYHQPGGGIPFPFPFSFLVHPRRTRQAPLLLRFRRLLDRVRRLPNLLRRLLLRHERRRLERVLGLAFVSTSTGTTVPPPKWRKTYIRTAIDRRQRSACLRLAQRRRSARQRRQALHHRRQLALQVVPASTRSGQLSRRMMRTGDRDWVRAPLPLRRLGVVVASHGVVLGCRHLLSGAVDEQVSGPWIVRLAAGDDVQIHEVCPGFDFCDLDGGQCLAQLGYMSNDEIGWYRQPTFGRQFSSSV